LRTDLSVRELDVYDDVMLEGWLESRTLYCIAKNGRAADEVRNTVDAARPRA
jgi:hypothetical protein